MKGYYVYSKIQQFRTAGFSQRQVARRLGINRKTVKRYWEMPVNEYEEMSSAICRTQYLNKYQKQILNWLQEFPDMTAAQVSDWLKEQYREEMSERTVSRYVKQLREEFESGSKKLTQQELLGLATNLSQVKSGQKVFKAVLGTKTYDAWAKRIDNWGVPLVDVGEAWEDFSEKFRDAVASDEPGWHIIKSQTALGKTQALLEFLRDTPLRVLIAVPTNNLKREVCERTKKMGVDIVASPSLHEIKDDISDALPST